MSSEAIKTQRWADDRGVSNSLYKLKEPIAFSEEEDQWGYLLIEKRLSTYYLVIRTLWFEYDKRWETHAYPSDNTGKPLELSQRFQALEAVDHDQLMIDNGYEVNVIGK